MLLGGGERADGIAPRFLIAQYRQFEENDEGKKGEDEIESVWSGFD